MITLGSLVSETKAGRTAALRTLVDYRLKQRKHCMCRDVFKEQYIAVPHHVAMNCYIVPNTHRCMSLLNTVRY